jgi:hypothetical protein
VAVPRSRPLTGCRARWPGGSPAPRGPAPAQSRAARHHSADSGRWSGGAVAPWCRPVTGTAAVYVRGREREAVLASSGKERPHRARGTEERGRGSAPRPSSRPRRCHSAPGPAVLPVTTGGRAGRRGPRKCERRACHTRLPAPSAPRGGRGQPPALPSRHHGATGTPGMGQPKPIRAHRQRTWVCYRRLVNRMYSQTAP